MATIYVDDDGDNTTGASWATAYTSITNAAVTGAAAGSVILVRNTHTETHGATTTIDFTGATAAAPIKIISSDGSDVYTKGAKLFNETGIYDLNFDGEHLYCAGLVFASTNASSQIFLQGFSEFHEYYDCEFNLTGGGSSYVTNGFNAVTRFIDCVFDIAYLLLLGESTFEVLGGSLTTSNTGYAISPSTEDTVLFDGVDLSGVTSTKLIDSHEANWRTRITIRRCKLPGAITLDPYTTGRDSWILFEGCKDSATQTTTVPMLGLTQFESYEGRIKSDLVEVRTDGASDGENLHSWAMTGLNSVANVIYLKSPPITAWADATATSVTVYVANSVDLTDSEFWCECLSPNEEATATPQHKIQTSRVGPLGAAGDAALARSSGTTWAGSNTGVDGSTGQQKIVFTIAPTEAGPVTVYCYLAKVDTMYVDPKLEIA